MESEISGVATQDSKNIALMTWIGTIFFDFIPGSIFYLIGRTNRATRSMRAILSHIKRTRETCRTVKGIAIGQRLAVAVVAACALTGCPPERQITDAINEKIIKEKPCFAIQEKGVPNWPMRIQRPMGAMSEKPLDPILAAMQAADYLQITQATDVQGGFLPVTIDVIMPSEKAREWWNVQEGFCVGTKAVADVQEWTEPGNSGVPIQVQFTWHLVDVPSWANRAEFKDIPGMTTPVQGSTMLQKTNKGWKSVL